MLIRLDPRDSVDSEGRGIPLHRQIYEHLRQAILDRELEAGRRLPSSRDLARELRVSRNVVLMAFDQLLAEGYVEGRVGAGTFVADALPELWGSDAPPSVSAQPSDSAQLSNPVQLSDLARRALALRPFTVPAVGNGKPRYDFRYGGGQPDEQGLKVWRRLLNRHAEQLCYGYGAVEGHPALRQQILHYVRHNRGVRCQLRQVLVVGGSQQALDLSARVLINPGDRVLIEEPQYQGARKSFAAIGGRVNTVPVDEEGFDIDAAPSGPSPARLIYVTPSHQFPTGGVMSLGRRLKLLEWAAEQGAYILEDDYDSEFRYTGRPVEAVQGLDRRGRTIYAGTLSKILSPTLRLGYVIVPLELVDAFTAVKWLSDRHTPTLEQAVLAEFMAEGHFDRHLRRVRTRNARRRQAVIEALERHLGDRVRITGTNAGVHLLVWLRGVVPEGLRRIIQAAADLDVGVYSCAPYFQRPPDEAGLLLGYATLTTVEIEEGIRRLSTVLKS